MLGDSCGGCQYHNFPYDSQIPILINGFKEIRTFTCKEDVYEVIDLLIKEVNEVNEKGKEFDIAESINSQLPFFACRNALYDKDIQEDIRRYLYCTEVNVAPYDGGYNQQPALWVDRFFIIKKAIAKKEKKVIRDAKHRTTNDKV